VQNNWWLFLVGIIDSGTFILATEHLATASVMNQGGTPHYSDRLCSNRRYSDSPQSGRRMADWWLQLNRPTGSKDWKNAEPNPKQIRGSTIMSWMQALYVVTLPEEGASPRSTKIPSPGTASLSHLGASIMHATPRPLPISSQFLLFLLMTKRAKDVLGRPDCGLSE